MEVLQDQHGDESRPDLRLHSIGAGPEKRLDLQVLFDGLEKQLDLPPVLVDRRDRGRCNKIWACKKPYERSQLSHKMLLGRGKCPKVYIIDFRPMHFTPPRKV